MESKKIKSALISVFYKDGLEPIVRELNRQGVTIYSTGGTYKFIADLGIEPVAVESLTGYPSILGGRVKTLHPKVFGGILSRRDIYSDGEQLKEYEIPEIDLVIVDLYPFEQTVASGAAEQDIIEKIDIGTTPRERFNNHEEQATRKRKPKCPRQGAEAAYCGMEAEARSQRMSSAPPSVHR